MEKSCSTTTLSTDAGSAAGAGGGAEEEDDLDAFVDLVLAISIIRLIYLSYFND